MAAAMSVDMRVDGRGGMVIVVVAVEMDVHQRRTQRPYLQDDRQAHRKQPTHHRCIVPAWHGRVNLKSS